MAGIAGSPADWDLCDKSTGAKLLPTQPLPWLAPGVNITTVYLTLCARGAPQSDSRQPSSSSVMSFKNGTASQAHNSAKYTYKVENQQISVYADPAKTGKKGRTKVNFVL
jgi:hypothetical protein